MLSTDQNSTATIVVDSKVCQMILVVLGCLLLLINVQHEIRHFVGLLPRSFYTLCCLFHHYLRVSTLNIQILSVCVFYIYHLSFKIFQIDFNIKKTGTIFLGYGRFIRHCHQESKGITKKR